jgi:hypothetical protein
LLLVPAGTITFALWAIRAAARWGSNQPPTHRRGVLKWVFLGLLACGIGVLLARSRPERRVAPSAAMEATAVGLAPDRVTNAVSPNVAPTPGTPAVAAGPSIRFIFTAVELREEQGTQWLAFDYVDQTEGNCERGFKYLTDLPDFKAQTRMTAMITGEGNPPVRHQRVEFRMPGAVSRGELLKFRDAVAKRLVGKSSVVRPGEEYPLFKLPVEDKGTLAGFALALQKPTTP